VYEGISSIGHVHAPKNDFLRETLNSNLENCVSGKANAMYAYIGNFWAITDAP
jgi:hypothetical protein